MTTDHPGHKALAAQVVQAPVLAIALSGRIHQGQPPGAAGFLEILFQCDGHVLGETGSHKSPGGDRLAVADDLYGLFGADDLVLARAVRG